MLTAFSELLRRNQQVGNIRHQMVAQKNNMEVILKSWFRFLEEPMLFLFALK